jgi:predicted DsbA family dithiol-disulfide isomerase
VSGLDLAAWDTCVADPAVRTEVEADAAEAKSLGITGTPTLIIGDWMQSGIPAAEDLYARIDEALGN